MSISKNTEPRDGGAGREPLSRRDFIHKAAAVAGATAAVGAVSKRADASVYKSILPASVLGANELIRTGHIGLGGMGTADLKFTVMNGGFQPIMLCDLRIPHVEQRVMKMFA
jgi:hypothetical protein